MKIKRVTVGELSTNCYVVSNEKEAVIIDPGDDGDKIIKAVEDKILKPKLCLLTHAHFDHVLAVVDIIERYKIPLLLNEKDLFLLRKGVDVRIQKYLWEIYHFRL